MPGTLSNAPSATIQPGQSNAPIRLAPASTTTRGAENGTNSTSTVASNISDGGSTNAMDALDDRYKLAVGDRLSFRIVQDEDDPRQVLVNDSGDVEVPYIGRYLAVNTTCKELASKLKAELEKEYYYHATVIIEVTESARRQIRRGVGTY